MEEYLVSEVERFKDLVSSIIEKVQQETAPLMGMRKERRTEEILHQHLAQFIQDIPSPEPVLAALKWRFPEELEKDLQFKKNIESFWRGEPLNRANQSIGKKYPRILQRLKAPTGNPLALLSPGSWFLTLQIQLKKPYLGKDDGEVHVQDNPICRDKLFHLPFIRPTTWKGNLRSTAWLLGYDKNDPKLIVRLFGNSRGEEKGQSGRLYFYPTFFMKAGIDLITPLKRQTKTPKRGPLHLECIPSGEEGSFSLLYLANHPKEGKEQEEGEWIREDLGASYRIVQATLFEYGFSAKKAEGYGTADERFTKGRFSFNQKKAGQPEAVETVSREFNNIQELNTDIKSLVEGSKGE